MRGRSSWWRSGVLGASEGTLLADYDFSVMAESAGVESIPNQHGPAPDLANAGGSSVSVVSAAGRTWGVFDGGALYSAALPSGFQWQMLVRGESVQATLPWTCYHVVWPEVLASPAHSAMFPSFMAAAPGTVWSYPPWTYFATGLWTGGGSPYYTAYPDADAFTTQEPQSWDPGGQPYACVTQWAGNRLASASWAPSRGAFVWDVVSFGDWDYAQAYEPVTWLGMGNGAADALTNANWAGWGFLGKLGEWQLWQGRHSPAVMQSRVMALAAKWGL